MVGRVITVNLKSVILKPNKGIKLHIPVVLYVVYKVLQATET